MNATIHHPGSDTATDQKLEATKTLQGIDKRAVLTAALIARNAASEITDKRGYAQRWAFSTRHVSNLLAQGLPHLAIGKRRVRIIVAEADIWMKERFGTQRRGPANGSAK